MYTATIDGWLGLCGPWFSIFVRTTAYRMVSYANFVVSFVVVVVLLFLAL